MDISSHIYKISEVPLDIIDLIEKDIKTLDKLLDIEAYGRKLVNVSIFEYYLDRFPPLEHLPNDAQEELGEKGSQEYSFSAKHMDIVSLSKMLFIRNLLVEQIEYLDNYPKNNECEIYYVLGLIDGHPYGGVLLFHNHNNGDVVLMQGITKFLIPGLRSIFLPREDRILPRLNSVLMPAIESLANKLGANKIFVSPIGVQGKILTKHYGFKDIERTDFIYPCSIIKGQKNDLRYLVKEL